MLFNISHQNKKCGGVYLITTIHSDKVYVGSTINFINRFKEHRYCLTNGKHHCKHLQNIVNKYGLESLYFSDLEIITPATKKSLLERENFFMSQYPLKFNSALKAYSLLGHRYTSKEEREKIDERNKRVKETWANNPQKRAERGAFMKSMWQDPEYKESLLKNRNAVMQTKDYKNKMSSVVKERWSDKDYKERVLNSKRKAMMTDSYKAINSINNKGSRNKNSMLSESKVLQIKILLGAGNKTKEIAKMYSVSDACIIDIRSGRTWSHIIIPNNQLLLLLGHAYQSMR